MSSKPAIDRSSGHAQAELGRRGQCARRHLVVEAEQGGRPLVRREQVKRRLESESDGRLTRDHQPRVEQGARLGQGRDVPGPAGVAGQPVLGAGEQPDAAVAVPGQVAGQAPGAREVAGRHRRDVARHVLPRVDDHKREAALLQGDEFLARLGRQHHDRAADAGAVGQRRQHRRVLGGLARVEHELAAVQVERLGDRRDDQSEVVGQQVGAADEDGAGAGRAASRAAAAELVDGLLHQLTGAGGDMFLVVEHPRDRRDRHTRVGGDVTHGRTLTRHLGFSPITEV